MACRKNDNIQILRGIACFMVFLSHICGSLNHELLIGKYRLSDTPVHLLYSGNAAVVIFFVLSGFFFYSDKKELSIKSFCKDILKRFIRLYPSFFIIMLVGLLARTTCPEFRMDILSDWSAQFWAEPFSVKEYVMNLLLLPWANTRIINPVVWTLKVEMEIIFVLPFINFLLKKNKCLLTVFLWMVILLLSLKFTAFAYLPAFFIGMLLRRQFIRMKFSLKKWQIRVVFILGLLVLDMPYILSFAGVHPTEYITNLLFEIGSAGIIWAVWNAKNHNSRIFRIFVCYGYESYYFYLTHFIILMWMRFSVEYIGIGMYAIVVFAMSIVAAILLHRIDSIFQKSIWSVLNKKNILCE